MQQFPATEAKNRWGAIADAAIREPVTITCYGKPSLVVTSVDEYQEYQRLKYQKLKADIQAGIKQADEGDFSAKSFDDIKTEARRRLQG